MNSSLNSGQLPATGSPSSVSLREYALRISQAVASHPGLNGAWVRAEMIDLRVNGGHCYMELIEKNESGATVAKQRAMIWRNNLERLRLKFFNATGSDIMNGLKVMVRCSATHHPVYGLSIVIDDIDPSYTIGDFERLRREILEKLQKEGILNRNKELKLPVVPQRIAVISSATAAGYQDFMDQLEHNPGGYKFYTHLFPAILQGNQTASSVIAALKKIEMVIDLFDCVVIIRGGGATTDMNGFDDYELARCVATYSLPVIVGIGHERDNCVLDYIAAVRCKTPTAVAAYLSEAASKAWNNAVSLMQQISRYATDRLEGEHRILAQSQTLIATVARGRVDRERMRISHISEALPLGISRLTSAASTRLESAMQLIASAASHATERRRLQLDNMADSLRQILPSVIERNSSRLDSMESLVEAYSPSNTLRRGYSITLADGKAVTDASDLKPGQLLLTRLKEGVVESIVEKAR